ncbi:phosphoribosylanthranilate isomerase [Mucilaginibacter pedocola]|uniref:N-(5'-phosphoribosyl)anthranilate isomerase n=1 Tax=Mucilaginibacter pedocola TaxID=1792845 RepID=A0A1S9PM25_9SPHI|nr:phosphoribosylanthranilate isomerase [Mucilaginibacter pedocola]OOQ61995.1 N-(5'-phosphoribosyl)anthranilate isomerase [Mucilaginibacter pedocola]
MRIKVCGLKYPDNIADVAALSPDYMGFIYYSRSPRFIGELDEDVLETLPDHILKTGVFVNASVERVSKTMNKYGFDALQFHGTETPDYCALFRPKVQVLKAFGVDEDFDFGRLEAYENKVDYFLFDTKTAAHGGSGQTFNWSVLNKYTGSVPFFLSGGLSLENLAEVGNINHPMLYGVDLNSRFESAPAEKDINKLKEAFNIIKTFSK